MAVALPVEENRAQVLRLVSLGALGFFDGGLGSRRR